MAELDADGRNLAALVSIQSDTVRGARAVVVDSGKVVGTNLSCARGRKTTDRASLQAPGFGLENW